MFAVFAAFLLITYLMGTRSRAPLRVLALAWFIAAAPILTALIQYEYLPYNDWQLPLVLMGYLSCFVLGAVLSDANSRPSKSITNRTGDDGAKQEFLDTVPLARICWLVAMVGAACVCLDFFALQGAGLDDISALRDTYVGRSEASLFARLGSVMTWACLYCFAFSLTYRARLSRIAFATFMMPIGGFFLVSVFSAGRQSAFQIMIFTVLVLWINHVRNPKKTGSRKTILVFSSAISGLMISYMGYIAVVRNNGNISDDKVEVLTRLFNLRLNDSFDSLLKALGNGVRTTVTEGLVYFSSSISLFSKFLHVRFSELSMGAVSFPFVFRQIQSFTGINVIEAYTAKVDAMLGEGVIGVGWETGISSYIQDFGVIGACIFLFLEGYYTAYVWRRAINGNGFNQAMVAVVAIAAVVYMPIIAAMSDTNLFLFWLFCIFAARRNDRIKRERKRRALLIDPENQHANY